MYMIILHESILNWFKLVFGAVNVPNTDLNQLRMKSPQNIDQMLLPIGVNQ